MGLEWGSLSLIAFVTLIPCLATIGSAALAFRAAVANNRKNLFVTTITKERAEWRKDLRLAASELARTTHILLADSSASIVPTAEEVGAFHVQRIAIRLRVNPNPDKRHHLDQAILLSLDALSRAVNDRCRETAKGELGKIEQAVQLLLKQEWDKSKTEAQTGEMQV